MWFPQWPTPKPWTRHSSSQYQMSYLNFDFIELNQNMYKMAIVSYWTLILVDVNLLPIFAFVLQFPPPSTSYCHCPFNLLTLMILVSLKLEWCQKIKPTCQRRYFCDVKISVVFWCSMPNKLDRIHFTNVPYETIWCGGKLHHQSVQYEVLIIGIFWWV